MILFRLFCNKMAENEHEIDYTGSQSRSGSLRADNNDNEGSSNNSKPDEPPTKVFVGQLTEDVYSEDLRELFCKFGRVVECDVLKDFGFVHFAHAADAELAVKALDNAFFFGRNIRVETSKSKVRQKPGMKAEGCFRCGEKGHWSKDCPQGPKDSGRGRGRDVRPRGGRGRVMGGRGDDRSAGGRYPSRRYTDDRYDPYPPRERLSAMDRYSQSRQYSMAPYRDHPPIMHRLPPLDDPYGRPPLDDPYARPPMNDPYARSPLDDPYARTAQDYFRGDRIGRRFDRYDR